MVHLDLRERLRLMRAAGLTRPAPGPTPAPPAGPPTIPPPSERFGGTLLSTPAGPVLCVERAYPVSHRCGRMAIGDLLSVPGIGWERVGRHGAWAGFDPANAAFFDTETTNLERSQGNYIFLAGVGRFVNGHFRVRQFFMRDYGDQEAVLYATLAELAGAAAVVTFNGKGFDWPVLAARCTIARLPVPTLPHLDLLPPARRLWQAAMDSCRLVDLEAAVLGAPRDGDIPGSMAPALYLEWLHTGAAEPLDGVIRHNRDDIIALAALAGYLGLAAADPLRAAPGGEALPATELLALGRQFLNTGAAGLGVACLEAALERGLPGRLKAQGQRLLGFAYRRAAEHQKAVATWLALAEESRTNLVPYIELAKHFEHRARNLPAARAMALTALSVMEERYRLAGRPANPALARDLEAIRHRLARLESKLARR